MASSTGGRITVQGETNRSICRTKEPFDQNCARCGGLLVRHICMDFYNTGNELEIPAQRCVQCGDVLDSVILRNRRITHQSTIAHRSETKVFSRETHVTE